MGEAMAEDGLLHTAEILKTALPYVDVKSKLILDLLVKLYELIACLRNFRAKDMAACGFENTGEKVDAEALLKKIRPSCNQKERAFVDKILNIFQAKRIFEMYNTYMEAMKAMEGFDGFAENDNSNDNTYNFMDSFSDFDLSAIIGDDNIDVNLHKDNNTYAENDLSPDKDYSLANDLSLDNGYNSANALIKSNNYISDNYLYNNDTFNENNDYNKSNINYANDPDNNNIDNNSQTEKHQATKESPDNSNLIEALKAMLPPEQIETFENLRMLFDSMSYDDNKKPESDKE